MERAFDDAWVRDRDCVVADMNGSAIFLVAALKMKLKMAIRRRIAREEGNDARREGGGPLSGAEQAAFDEALETMLDRFDLHGALGVT